MRISRPSRAESGGARVKEPDRRVAIPFRWLWAGGLVACVLGRSEDSVRNEFSGYVSGANQCADATECTVAWTECPLGCFVAVRADRKAEVEAKGRDLVSQYARGGKGCSYDCATPGGLICVAGRCDFGYAQPAGGSGGVTGGTGGVASTGGQAGGDGGGTAGIAGGGPIPKAYLSITPTDGTTAALDVGLGLSLYDPAGLLDDPAIEALRGATVIETWPEKTPIPAVATVSGAGGSSGPTIQVTPGAALGDRWYAVSVTGLPAKVVATAMLADGSVAARFQPLSHPRVRTIEVCEKAAPGSKLIVSFSEPVVYSAAAATLVSLAVAGTASPCEVDAAGPAALHLRCAELTPSSHAAISVGAGIQSESMIPLAPVTFDIDVAALPAGSCRTFQPPIP